MARCSETTPEDSPSQAETAGYYSASVVSQCKSLLDDSEAKKLIRGHPRPDRIDVEEGLWIALPAESKTGILLAVNCVTNGRPLSGFEYVSAYGYRSGRRLALATSVGVKFD